ncbi:Manganese transport system membrane protein MntB [Nocardia farcinica]|uniref:zinc ABC transporter permease AztB n=1 Tax=Nocardia farcinica TaxID=37329 RepID=UPI000BF3A162|nr:zinc ABC transporter permease AztB [Nocardia farcinica]PFX05055.1 Manganese transport system membrane protein MntB [Nocardia farcinica]PFX09355.1 Manganese transport system membrane protein MntB [Nocardia farcinica]
MEWLLAPFEVSFVQRALWGGLLVSCLCAIAGTWVVVRGMAFLSDAMAHGMLPGIAVAALLGGNLVLGAAVSAAAMALGVSALTRSPRFSADIGIGLLFVGMLAIGVVIISRAQSFAVDLTGFLFGDVLAIRDRDLTFLATALLLAGIVAALGHRAFVALAFDPRLAHTLGLRPRLAQAAMLGLITLAIVASFHVVGTLLVFGLLIAPPAAATLWAHRIPVIMALAALLGASATVAGLLISWHAGTAAGATIAVVAVALFFLSAAASAARSWWRGRRARAAAATVAVAAVLTGCAANPEPVQPEPTPHGYIAGAEETAEPQPRLVLADSGSGAVRVLDLVSEQVTELPAVPGVRGIAADGRHAYLSDGAALRIVDTGSWLVDHGDHTHYYRAPIREVGTRPVTGDARVLADRAVAAVHTGAETVLLDRGALDDGSVRALGEPIAGTAVPYAEHLVIARPDGRVEVRTRDGAPVTTLPQPCPEPRGSASTRRGVVFGCADGALVVHADGTAFAGTPIAYPHPVPATERATEFRHRPGSATLAARAGDRGAWLLDVRARTWTLVPAGPVLAANTAGEGAPLLTLTADGMLHAHDPVTGVELAGTQLLATVDPAAAPTVTVDSARAYVNDPAGRRVFEIDYADLRVARTFPLDIAPALMVETGE